MPDLVIGADPELFVFNGNKPVSGWGMVEGTKARPTAVKHGAVQVDGMALEINIDPVDDVDKFHRNINSVLRSLRKMIPDGHELKAVPTVRFSEKVMKDAPKAAKELGCDPDWNAYTEKQNPRPRAIGNRKFLRTGAGHIHLGWTADQQVDQLSHFLACVQMTKQLDLYVGLPSLLFDNDRERQQLYGKAGTFRPKPYGVEYRTPSNFWVQKKSYREMIFNLVNYAFEDLRNYRGLTADGENLDADNIRDVFNAGDKLGAMHLITAAGILEEDWECLPESQWGRYFLREYQNRWW
jgi:hypothetical protein|tara:strand:- start:15030 stop:15914 length:885 start_codon:yes stop_codon:yes gene_type:complete